LAVWTLRYGTSAAAYLKQKHNTKVEMLNTLELKFLSSSFFSYASVMMMPFSQRDARIKRSPCRCVPTATSERLFSLASVAWSRFYGSKSTVAFCACSLALRVLGIRWGALGRLQRLLSLAGCGSDELSLLASVSVGIWHHCRLRRRGLVCTRWAPRRWRRR